MEMGSESTVFHRRTHANVLLHTRLCYRADIFEAEECITGS
jgi:hypothetical protein